MMAKVTYKEAGVDLELYQDAMRRLPRLIDKTETPRVRRLPGGFAGLFQLDFENPMFRRNYEDPTLISCTDGVGTKLKVAMMMNQHDTVGIDLVAMSVNDAICCGAEPLFFLDYVAMGVDNPILLEQLVEGITEGCVQAGCALLGGETAIMPDLYAPGDYDLAGFCVGVASKKDILDGSRIKPGDAVIGVGSTGLHSNGFSLVRRVVFNMAGLEVADKAPEDLFGSDRTVGDVLITPTRIYVKAIRSVMDIQRPSVHGIAHITGGGLHENLERILPEGVRIEIERDSWDVKPVFKWIQRLGEIEPEEMYRVFNMGLGLVLVVDHDQADAVREILSEQGMENWLIGRAIPGEKKVVWKD